MTREELMLLLLLLLLLYFCQLLAGSQMTEHVYIATSCSSGQYICSLGDWYLGFPMRLCAPLQYPQQRLVLSLPRVQDESSWRGNVESKWPMFMFYSHFIRLLTTYYKNHMWRVECYPLWLRRQLCFLSSYWAIITYKSKWLPFYVPGLRRYLGKAK